MLSVQGCESICEKKKSEKSEIIWIAWKDVLFNALNSKNGVLWRAKRVRNQIKIWTLTSLLYTEKQIRTYHSQAFYCKEHGSFYCSLQSMNFYGSKIPKIVHLYLLFKK